MPKTSDHVPNPRRVAAGKANRQKRGPLTEEGRQRLRISALRNKPWLSTTGPKTPEGRAQAARNGKRRQKGPLSVREARAELAKVRAMIRAAHDLCARIGTP